MADLTGWNIHGTAYNLADTAQRAMTADEYDNTATYAVGDYCIHSGVLYICTTAISTAEAWTATHWTETVVGDELTELKSAIGGDVTVSGTTPTITAAANTRYLCGEVSTISFTPSATGICDVIFTSGTTAAVLTIPATVKFPAGVDMTSLETSTIYEINVLNGVYGVVATWPLS